MPQVLEPVGDVVSEGVRIARPDDADVEQRISFASETAPHAVGDTAESTAIAAKRVDRCHTLASVTPTGRPLDPGVRLPVRVPTRWHVAGLVRRRLPDVRGADRLTSAIAGGGTPRALARGPVEVRFGPGLQATVHVTQDGSLADVFFLQYRPPALVPILQAVLDPGSVFYDVGANIGIYSLWAARLVGARGQVVAFEPVPATADRLADLVGQNELRNVEVVRAAVSGESGQVLIELVPHASGLSRVVDDSGRAPGAVDDTVAAPTVVLDQFVVDHPPPTLIKIDVEGHEASVVAGMGGLLESVRPAVVFEAPDFVEADGRSGALVATFAGHDYGVWSLTRAGLAPFSLESFSHNLLALHRTHHDGVRQALARTSFSRNQNC